MSGELQEWARVNHMLTTSQVSEKTGASIRQLQWWDEHGTHKARRRGGMRWYSPDSVKIIDRLMTLRRAGVTFRKAEPIAADLRSDIKLVLRSIETCIGLNLFCSMCRSKKWDEGTITR